MVVLETRVEETAAMAEASSDKVSAVSSTSKTLRVQLDEMQRKTATEIPALDRKVPLSGLRKIYDGGLLRHI